MIVDLNSTIYCYIENTLKEVTFINLVSREIFTKDGDKYRLQDITLFNMLEKK